MSGIEGAPKHLDPRAVFRAALFIQSAFRRWQLEDPRRLLGIEPTMPSPALRVAMAWKQRLCRPETVDVQAEAMAAVSVICGRNKGLTLGPIVACFHEYEGKLPEEDAIFALLRERFVEVAADMDEAVLAKLQEATRPSEARNLIEREKAAWGVPEKPLVPDMTLFPLCQERIEDLKRSMEGYLTARMEFTTTRRSLQKLSQEVELEFLNCHTPLRARVLKARQAHKARVELEVQANYGWPPKGRPALLLRALRWFALELGSDHPSVEDFRRAAMRELKKVEVSAEEACRPIEEATAERRRRLAIWPPAPKLIQQGITEQLEEILENAKPTLEAYSEELALESPTVLRRFSGILKEAFVDRCLQSAAATADLLRACEDKADQEERRLQFAAQLWQLLEVLQGEGTAGMAVAVELGTEFEIDLEEVKPLISLTRPDLLFMEEEPDDGWHRPPDFREVDQPLAEEEPVEEVREVTPEPVVTAVAGPDISVSMKLHSVALEDARAKSEILLMERCAMIIAEECGIPRQWISNLAFAAEDAQPWEPLASIRELDTVQVDM
mmetsp:Transcript_15620/g.36883  ORF Transcript_15620/g.36883 Transcript_15620/m.36883 type:complete len:556 (+) Transcript_15620:43-1710(+)